MPYLSTRQALFWLSLFCGFFCFLHCSDQGPATEEYLTFDLKDSLTLFDSVQIELVNPDNPNQVYQVIHAGKLTDPTLNHAKIKVAIPGSPSYVIRVRGWIEQELGWDMLIVNVNGKNVVVSTALPPVRPYLVDLAQINPSAGTLEPEFQPGRVTYSLPIEMLTDSLSLKAIPADNRATVTIRKGLTNLGGDSIRMAVPEGSTELTVDVSNKGDKKSAYRITVLRPNIPEPRLRNLKVSVGTLMPSFNAEGNWYSMTLPDSVTRLSFPEFVLDTFVTAIVGGDTLQRGQKPNSVNLVTGPNDIKIRVFTGHKFMDYVLSITVLDAPKIDTVDTNAPPPVKNTPPPRLLDLEIREGAILPLFNDLTYQYALTVGDSIEELHFKSLKADSFQAIVILGDTLYEGDLPDPIPIAEGSNTLRISAINAKGKDTTYVLHVTRKAKLSFMGYKYSARIQLNTTATGANIGTRILGFAVPIRLHRNNFNFATSIAEGQDLRVFTPEGKPLPFEIENWDSAGKEAALWVRFDTLAANTQKDMAYLCWGSDTVNSLSQPAAVFPPSDEFAAVWHMGNGFVDATGNGNTGAAQGGATASNSGLLGQALFCDSASALAQGVNFGNSASLSSLTTAIQVEGWVKSKQFNIAASVFRHEWHFNALRLLPNGGAASSFYNLFTDTSQAMDKQKKTEFPWRGTWNDNAWHYFVAQYDANIGLFLYWDGKLSATLGGQGGLLAATTKPFMVGLSESGDQPFHGTVDEIRVSKVARSAAWIQLNYESQKPDSKLVTVIP